MIATEDRIQITNDRLSIHFNRFTIDDYRFFLRVKSLPEYDIAFNDADESYTITAPSRFAAMLGVQPKVKPASALPFPSFLFDDQSAILEMALAAKRYACWSDCGLGKTFIEAEFARQVIHLTGGKFLQFTLNEIVNQWIEMVAERYGDTLPVLRLKTRDEMREWCRSLGPGLAITNYEKMNHKADGQQVVSEMKYLAGVGLDESSRLKGGGGKQKWALIKSCRGIEYKLSCTATPAPNDTIEFASQASFLEKMRSDNDIIWTFFHRDPKTREWTVKRHARKAFFTFMSAWSIYVRDPRKYGWRLGHPDVPKPIVKTYDIKPTDEQIAEMQRLSTTAKNGQRSLLDTDSRNAIQRSKLSQVAKGFIYLKGESARKVRLIDSNKPGYITKLVQHEVANGLQVLVWTVFDAESQLLSERLLARHIRHDLLTGKTKPDDRIAILDRFRHNQSRVLVSRASMLGYGQNFQQCGSMIFSGWNDSYESYYQALRRAYRFGQTKPLQVHIPVIHILEGDMLENIFAKESKHEAAITEMEQNCIAATKRLKGT